MSDIDAIVRVAERRIARSGRSALARARAEDRLAKLVEATAAKATVPPRSPRLRWIVPGGAVVFAGLFLASLYGTTKSSSLTTPATLNASIAVRAPLPSTHASIAVDNLPSAAPDAPPSVREEEPAAAPRPSVVAIPPSARRDDRAPTRRAGPSAATVAPEPSPSKNAAPEGEPAVEGPSALFERANDARRGADYAAAEKLYRRLLDTYPASREAATSRVIFGRMLLSRSEPRAALELFDRYLADAPKASLSEQALVGRARCLQRLSRTDEERAAWRHLLDTFPSSPNRAEALSRLR